MELYYQILVFNYEWKEHRAGRVAERERLLAEVEEDILVEEEEECVHDEEGDVRDEEGGGEDQEELFIQSVESPRPWTWEWSGIATERQISSTQKVFLSDPGVPGVRSMGPVVFHWLTDWFTFVQTKLMWLWVMKIRTQY